MKQILLELSSGTVQLVEVPAPSARAGHLVVATAYTLVSAGTERSLVDFGRSGWLSRALAHRDKVSRVIDKVRTDGLAAAWAAVRDKLDRPVSLGYCASGVVLEVGDGVDGFRAGDRVVTNGPHAELVRVPATLAARLPDSVPLADAPFAVIGAIALEGLRLARPELGETVAVFGLGLVGLAAVQLLIAQGCRVIAVDPDPERAAHAARAGALVVDPAADPVEQALAMTRQRGVDAAVVATATASDAPMTQAARMCRQRGRLVLIGVAGLNLARDDFYKKELTFAVSCSYGPGRHDPAYEEEGRDYPFGLVRWTAQRNIEAVLELMAARRLDAASLVTHRFELDDALGAYRALEERQPSLGMLIAFAGDSVSTTVPGATGHEATVRVRPASATQATGQRIPVLGVIGAGDHTRRQLLPALATAPARRRVIASSSGLSAARAAREAGFELAAPSAAAVLDDPEVDAVLVTTRHDSHAALAVRALSAGKAVYLEKPLAITEEQVGQLVTAHAAAPAPLLMVGFNRRFAPLVVQLRQALEATADPRAIVITVNAGRLPPDHWLAAPAQGGRIVGEGCHFIDLLVHLVAQPLTQVSVAALGARSGEPHASDTLTVTLAFCDGSVGTLHYFANGHPGFPKERIEVFTAGRVLVLDNFRKLTAHGARTRGSAPGLVQAQDKGHAAAVRAFLEAASRRLPSPVPFDEAVLVTRLTLALARAVRAGGGAVPWPPE